MSSSILFAAKTVSVTRFAIFRHGAVTASTRELQFGESYSMAHRVSLSFSVFQYVVLLQRGELHVTDDFFFFK